MEFYAPYYCIKIMTRLYDYCCDDDDFNEPSSKYQLIKISNDNVSDTNESSDEISSIAMNDFNESEESLELDVWLDLFILFAISIEN